MSTKDGGGEDKATEKTAATDKDSMAAAAKADKKKLKILKQALKEERAQRATVEQELQASHEKIEQLKLTINDKVSLSLPCLYRVGTKIPLALPGEHQLVGDLSQGIHLWRLQGIQGPAVKTSCHGECSIVQLVLLRSLINAIAENRFGGFSLSDIEMPLARRGLS